MSAWVVEKGHIDVLVNGLVQHGLVEPRDMQATGQMLWKENYRSVNYRYCERKRTPAYTPAVTEASIDPRHLLKAVECYEYQSCEHLGWETSPAKSLMATLHDLARPLAAALPHLRTNYVDDGPGTRWGYDRLDQAILSSEVSTPADATS